MPQPEALREALPEALPGVLAAAPVRQPHPSPASAEALLAESASAAAVSFVACGAVLADLGELLRDLRLALQVAQPRAEGPNRQQAAALLAERLESVRGALDNTTVAATGFLQECAPGAAAVADQPEGSGAPAAANSAVSSGSPIAVT